MLVMLLFNFVLYCTYSMTIPLKCLLYISSEKRC